MFNFNYYNPTHIVFGKNRLAEIKELVPSKGKILITYGGGSVKKFGTFDKIRDILKDFEIHEFGGIESNPQITTCLKAVELVKEKKIDFILSIGGGSVLDATKYISIAAKYQGNDYASLIKGGFNPAPVSEAIPFGAILTLPATGSEMNCFSVISTSEGKFGWMSPLVFPKFSVLDPTLTYTLPKEQLANGIIDTFVHIIEQYITYPVEAKVQDRFAEGVLKTLIEIADAVINQPEDYNTRANFMWCATIALSGIIGAGVPQDWSTHMIGHEFTDKYGIDHGRTLAMLLPTLLRERKAIKEAKLLQYAERVWAIKDGTKDEIIEAAILKTEQFFNSLEVPTRIGAYNNVKKEELKDIIVNLETHGMVGLSETGDLTLDIVERIIEDAY